MTDRNHALEARQNKRDIQAEPQRRTVDFTPTWTAILPMLLVGIKDGNETGRRIAMEELFRMAHAADMWNAANPHLPTDQVDTTNTIN